MLPLSVAIIAEVAIQFGFVFVLSKTVLRIQDKVWRFIFSFVLYVLMNFVLNYVNVQLLGFQKMDQTEVFFVSLLLATYVTFIWPWRFKSRQYWR
jgi:hypothetical protein